MDTCKKLLKYLTPIFIITVILNSCGNIDHVEKRVLTGADLLVSENIELVKNKNLGIITNHTALLLNGTHLVDTLFAMDDVNIVSLFGPEHGIRGDAPDGHSISDGVDSKTGLPIYSLYGKTKKPTNEMLFGIDLLIFDIQDIGARFYTFISTMYYAIQAAAENNIPIVILDRPNPITGSRIEGPVLDSAYTSFVGIAELPTRHGMTVGELALFFNRIEILNLKKTAQLKVIKMNNWERNFYYDDTKLHWVKPSPNMPTLETAIVYPGLCLIEGTNISEGRGTQFPFLQIGSPFIQQEELFENLMSLNLKGCQFEETDYLPVEIPNMSKYPKYKDQKCFGIKIRVTDRDKFQPIELGIKLIYLFNKLYPQNFSFNERRFDKLWGNSDLRESIENNVQPNEIINNYKNKLQNFLELRKKYLLYE